MNRSPQYIGVPVPVAYPIYFFPSPPLPFPSSSIPSSSSISSSSTLSFSLNGNPVSISNPDPTMSLNEYIRSLPGCTGTKLTCGEGGCGACTVDASLFDPTLNSNVSISINSCLRPLCSVEGMQITTTEGIGSQRKGFNSIQERIADNNGSQCGYCTPGMVMTMYSSLQSNSDPSLEDIEDAFDGNICRCTGYRPILSAMKSFSSESEKVEKCKQSCARGIKDIEELVPPKYEKYKVKDISVSPSPSVSLHSITSTSSWFTPLSLSDLYSLLRQYKEGVKLIVGNTSSGVFKNDKSSVFIDVHNIPELKIASNTTEGVTFGAAVTITDMIKLLSKWNNGSHQTSSFPTLVTHMKRIANHQVRNVGSWAGNLMMVHEHDDFPSDLCTILMASGATLTIAINEVATSGILISDFLSLSLSGCVILSVQIPFLQNNEIFSTYKVATRHQNSHAIVNAAFRAVVDPSSLTITSQPTLVFGGIATKTSRMPQTEASLMFKPLSSQSTLQNCLSILQKEAIPSTGPGRIEYRNSLATVFLYKFYISIVPDHFISPSVLPLKSPFVRPISSGVQTFQTKPDSYPVSQPIPKLKARLQASGEVIYAGDIPDLPNIVHAAFVTSTVASATLSTIDFKPAMKATGVIGYVTANDISGENNCGPIVENEEIFVSSSILYNGQALGLVIADSQRHANEAAKLPVSNYKNINTPILTIQQAIEEKSFFPNYPEEPMPDPIIVGDVNQAFASSDHVISGSIATPSQAHFHMETLTALAIPEEDGQLTIYASTQNSSALQMLVSKATGLTANKITVIVKPVGGGYGAKITKPNQIAAAAAVAALKYNRPVKLVMDLNTNMEMIGKRQPIVCSYKVGFSKEGKLNGIQYDLFLDSGCVVDVGPQVLYTVFTTIDNNTYCPNWLIQGTVCKTNLPSNTWMRGPGWINAVFFMEYVLDMVACYLNVDSAIIKELNMYKENQVTPYGQTLKFYTIPSMWATFKSSTNYEARLADIQQYNKNNKWTKKGISMTTVKFGIGWEGNQFGALINVYPDGTVNVNHGGIEIGQGIDTKVAQVVAYQLGIPVSKIVVTAANSQLVPNSSATGGSIASGLCSMAAISACSIINDRLTQVKQSLPSDATWDQLISAAVGQGIDLQAKGWANPPASPVGGPYQYNSYAVASSEILLDVLTGEYQNLRSDILFDCGISLNPAIDIGQVEGSFVQGIGLFMQEEILLDNAGNLISNGTWEYKPPCSQDIPIDFRVSLLANAPNPLGVLSSKASGEPPLACAACVFTSVRNAVQSARAQFGNSEVVTMNAPATVETTQTSCGLSIDQFTF